MKINNREVNGNSFAYEGCHKMYVLENGGEAKEAKSKGYKILPINEIKKTFVDSCLFRFISNWRLSIRYVPQNKKVIFKK